MPATEEVLTAALEQIEQGFAVFALKANAKVPVTEHGFKNATTRPDWIRAQLSAPPAGNYGLTWPADSPERVVVFDLDDGGGADRPWRERMLDLVSKHGTLPATKITNTPSGGRHAFYRWPASAPIPPGDELFGFTVRWPGRGYLVGPGSRIGDVEYTAGPVSEIAELPAGWVFAALAEHPVRQAASSDVITITGGFQLPDRIPSGRRYSTIRDYVASRYNAGLGLPELWDLVRTQVAPRFDQAKTEDELRKDFDRVVSKIGERLGPPASTGRQAHEEVASGPLLDAPLTEFDSRPVEWLWPSWLPRGVVTLMDGNPGVSKSTLVADLVARITTGRDWPDGQPGTGAPQRCMWITTEDDPGRVLRPRVEAAGGDAQLVRFVTSEVVFPSTSGPFTDLLVARASEPEGLALVILDPLFSHVDAKVRAIADSEMRRGVMNPLNEAAEAAGCSIIVVRHFNKDTAASAINRGAGSLGGIVGAARALWSVTQDPSDETGETKAIGVSKLNYAKARPALRYAVVDRVPPGWVTGTVSGIEWLGEADVSIGAMLTEGAGVGDAVQALEDILAKGPVPAAAGEAHMRSRGFGRDAVKSAKKRLGVVSSKTSMSGGWEWSLPSTEEVEGAEEAEGVDDTHKATSSKGWHATSSTSSASRGRAHTGRALYATSSTSSGESGHPFEEAEGVEEVGAPRAGAHVREGEAELRVVDGGSSAGVRCAFYQDHQSEHYRSNASGAWRCRICSPEEGQE